MRIRDGFIILVIFFLLICHCGKKEEGGEGKIIPSEWSQVDVTVPQASWKKSLAVLPLEGEPVSTRERMLFTMVMEGFVTRLSEARALKILPMYSRDWIENDRAGVDYLVMGKIEEENDRVIMVLELIDIQQNTILWTDTFEEEVQTLHAVEESASATVAKILGVTVDEAIESQSKSVSSDVLKDYLEGKSYLSGNTRSEINLAVQKFKDVLRVDSTYTPAYLGLAEGYLKIVENQWDRNLVWLELAQEVILKAIEVDPGLAEGYLQMGQIYLIRGDLKHAENEFKSALRRNPNLEKAWIGLGTVYFSYGLYEPCLEVYESALALNPANEEIALSRAMILTGLKRYGEAEEEILKTLRFHPDKIYFHPFLALVRYYQEDFTGAQDELRKGLNAQLYQPFFHAVQGMIYAKQGKLDDALGEIELEVKPNVGSDASLATAVAAIYTLIDRKGEAIQWLEKAVAWGYREYPWLVNDPNFEGLKKDPRFEQILKTMQRVWEANARQYQDLGY